MDNKDNALADDTRRPIGPTDNGRTRVAIENQNTQFDLRTMLGPHRTQLRKIKSGRIADTARNMLNKGIIASGGLHGPYIQFGQDIAMYGLWEALLYAEGYESQGHYATGTLERIAHKIVPMLLKSAK